MVQQLKMEEAAAKEKKEEARKGCQVIYSHVAPVMEWEGSLLSVLCKFWGRLCRIAWLPLEATFLLTGCRGRTKGQGQGLASARIQVCRPKHPGFHLLNFDV